MGGESTPDSRIEGNVYPTSQGACTMASRTIIPGACGSYGFDEHDCSFQQSRASRQTVAIGSNRISQPRGVSGQDPERQVRLGSSRFAEGRAIELAL